MKPSMVVAMILVLTSTGQAEHRRVTPTETIIVCMHSYPPIPNVKPAVAEVFARAGVAIVWKDSKCPKDGIGVSFQNPTPRSLKPGVLAYALPYERVDIRVFYDRIHLFGTDAESNALIYVIVHEITHILQGVATHSDEGVMKAEFTENDRIRMKRGEPLAFSPQDLTLIHNGIAARARALAAVKPHTGLAASITRQRD